MINEGQVRHKDNLSTDDREVWYIMLNKIAEPVIHNLANGTLKKNMPVEFSPTFDSRSPAVTYLEAVGRTLSGAAPWLALEDDDTREGLVRKRLRENALMGLERCFAPDSPDSLNFLTDYQPIVDAAYLVQAFLRAPKALWEPLNDFTKQRIIISLKSLRNRKPFRNNWLLFGSLTECFLLSIAEEYDEVRLKDGIQTLMNWYVGDGWYKDGESLAFDYYNSLVIHPMMVDALKVLAENRHVDHRIYDLALSRMQRYATGLERMISPEGTFPPIGRSITYRTGVFHALALTALMEQLPESISAGQVRSALTKIKMNLYGAPGTFDENGWLQIGFCGRQTLLGDYYISTGSLYMATLSFLPLGLPASNKFWTDPAADWTSKKAWSGVSFEPDYRVNF